MEWLNEFHFIRPLFLVLLLPAFVFVWLLWNKQKTVGNWSQVIDAHLLEHLTDNTIGHSKSSLFDSLKSRSLLVALLLAWIIGTIALAGPAWRKLPQPLHQQNDVMVIVLDLSLSMFAQDGSPSRVIQAKRKIEDVLKLREEGLTALVVYSGGANVVSPLTDDVNTILSLLPSLDPAIMPNYGSKLSSAVKLSQELLSNSGVSKGQLLIISDGVSTKEINNTVAHASNFDIGVLGVGKEKRVSVPIPKGQMLADKNGNQVLVARQTRQLKKLAQAVGGTYRNITLNDDDVAQVFAASSASNEKVTREDRTFDEWKDEGRWLVLLLIPVVLLSFRRGVLLSVVLCFSLSTPQPSNAFSLSDVWDSMSSTLFLNKDQQGQLEYENENYEKAIASFNSPEWKSAAYYKNADYQAALDYYQSKSDEQMSAGDYYNRGNAQAQLGQYDDAIASYEKALSYQPKMKDALHNKQLLEQMQQQSQEGGEQGEDGQQSQDGQESQNGEQQDGQQSDNQDGESSSGGSSEQEQTDVQEQLNKQQEQDGSEEGSEEGAATESKDDEQTDGQDGSETTTAQQNNEGVEDSADDENSQAPMPSSEALKSEEAQAMEQWLRRIPDDPSGLLRNKFQYQYQLERHQGKPTVEKDEEVFW